MCVYLDPGSSGGAELSVGGNNGVTNVSVVAVDVVAVNCTASEQAAGLFVGMLGSNDVSSIAASVRNAVLIGNSCGPGNGGGLLVQLGGVANVSHADGVLHNVTAIGNSAGEGAWRGGGL